MTEAGNDKAFSPLWSPDGKRLSFTNVRGETWSIEVDKPWREQTPQLLNPKREPPLQFWPAAWSSDGRRLLAGVISTGNLSVLTVYSFETGQLEKISDSGSPSTAWLQDDRRAVFIFDGAVFITDTAQKNSRPLFPRRPIGSSDSGSRATTAGSTTYWNLSKPTSGCSVNDSSTPGHPLRHVTEVLLQLSQGLDDIFDQRAVADDDLRFAAHARVQWPRLALTVDFGFGYFDMRLE